jgi:hypothetical protein
VLLDILLVSLFCFAGLKQRNRFGTMDLIASQILSTGYGLL